MNGSWCKHIDSQRDNLCVCKGCSCFAKCSEQSDWVGTRDILHTESFPPFHRFSNIFFHLNRHSHEFKVSLWRFTLCAKPWFPCGSPVAPVIWIVYKWLADTILSFFFFFLSPHLFLADKQPCDTVCLWHRGHSWLVGAAKMSAGRRFLRAFQQDCGFQCLPWLKGPGRDSCCTWNSDCICWETKDRERMQRNKCMQDFSRNNLSHAINSGTYLVWLVFFRLLSVRQCCIVFLCVKVKTAKRWKIQQVRKNINFSLNRSCRLWTHRVFNKANAIVWSLQNRQRPLLFLSVLWWKICLPRKKRKQKKSNVTSGIYWMLVW